MVREPSEPDPGNAGVGMQYVDFNPRAQLRAHSNIGDCSVRNQRPACERRRR